MYVQRGKNSILYDKDLIKSKYNIYPSQYVKFKSLTGDKCDIIAGINGIGKVTAAKILNYETIENFIENGENQKLISLIKENIEKIKRNEKLILLNDKIDTNEMIFSPLSEKLFNEKVSSIIEKIGLS